MNTICRLLAAAAVSIVASLPALAETATDKPAATATPIPTLHCDFKTVSACAPDGTCKAGKDLAGMPLPLKVTVDFENTVVAAVDSVFKAVTELGTKLNEATIAVVGATGAIGRGVAILLSEEVGRLVLIGNPARPEQSRKRLLKVAADICRHLAERIAAGGPVAPGTLAEALLNRGPVPTPDADAEDFLALAETLEAEGRLLITVDLDALLPEADLVVTATSSVEDLVTPKNLKFGAAVCDLSRPPNVSRAVKDARPDVLVIDGGVVAVPGLADLGWNFGFEKGLAYACMAETMILGLEHHYEDTSIGTDLNLPTILALRQKGHELGFRLAQLRSFDRPLSRAEWDRLMAIRSQGFAAIAGDD